MTEEPTKEVFLDQLIQNDKIGEQILHYSYKLKYWHYVMSVVKNKSSAFHQADWTIPFEDHTPLWKKVTV